MATSNQRGGMWSMLAAVGPGIVVTGSVIGSGELINTPVQAATFGFILLWAVLLSCVIKYFLQVEIARHCLVENRTTFQAINECPGPKFRGTSWIGLVYMGGYIITMLPVIGIIGGARRADARGLPAAGDGGVFGADLGNAERALGAALLWGGAVSSSRNLGDAVGRGIQHLGRRRRGADSRHRVPHHGRRRRLGPRVLAGPRAARGAFAVLSLMGALGVAANELFMYPYWVLEKGYAERLGDRADAAWAAKARHWINTIRLDAGLATIVATVVTAAFYLLGAAVSVSPGRDAAGARRRPANLQRLHGHLRRVVAMDLLRRRVLHPVLDAHGLHGGQRTNVDRLVLAASVGSTARIRRPRDALTSSSSWHG